MGSDKDKSLEALSSLQEFKDNFNRRFSSAKDLDKLTKAPQALKTDAHWLLAADPRRPDELKERADRATKELKKLDVVVRSLATDSAKSSNSLGKSLFLLCVMAFALWLAYEWMRTPHRRGSGRARVSYIDLRPAD